MAKSYRISRAHLMKVVNALTRSGYLIAVRGRSGGLRLATPANEIVLGDVVRATEPDFALVECFATGNQCVITGCCRLPRVLDEALDAFLGVLDRHTLESLTLRRTDFRRFRSSVGLVTNAIEPKRPQRLATLLRSRVFRQSRWQYPVRV
jgi:Rrf2 family nitric oxide-sensitive transcriptional repressor